MKNIYLKTLVVLIFISFYSCCTEDFREPKITSFVCDTQDNIIKLDGYWKINLDDYGERSSSIGFWRNSPTFTVQSEKEITSLVLSDFNYNYSVNYINSYTVVITSNYWEDYFLDTDTVFITIVTLN